MLKCQALPDYCLLELVAVYENRSQLSTIIYTQAARKPANVTNLLFQQLDKFLMQFVRPAENEFLPIV